MDAMALPSDVVALTKALIDIPSVSGSEGTIADVIAGELTALTHLETLRDGNVLVARTNLGRPTRVLLAGHLDTVPIAANVPAELRDGYMWGRGSVDMKGGCAVFLSLARALTAPRCDLTFVWYDNEEVEASKNGLGRVFRDHPDWLAADLAVLGEPTRGAIEGGCNGTLRARLTTHGVAAHSARPWRGLNAIHALGEVLRRLESYEAHAHRVGGLVFQESLLAVAIEGGKTLNSVPDRASVTVNFRFAPDRTEEQAQAHVRELFSDLPVDIEITDSAPAGVPGMDHDEFRHFATILAEQGAPEATAKLGWTDVARFSAHGIPAINCGPGDPLRAHQVDEACPIEQLTSTYAAFRKWLA